MRFIIIAISLQAVYLIPITSPSNLNMYESLLPKGRYRVFNIKTSNLNAIKKEAIKMREEVHIIRPIDLWWLLERIEIEEW